MGNLQPIPGRDPHLEGGTATLTLDDSPGDQDLILVVDDSEVNRCFLHDRVLTLGHTPILAKNGMEALQQIERQSPSLVLLDIMMPEMNGYQVLERMKADARLQHIPVIMVTAVDDMDSVVRCIQRGAVDYLLKPVNSTLLKARVDAALASKRLHDQEEAYRREIERYNQTLEERVRERTRELEKTRLEVIHRLGRAAEYRDNETGMHVIRMSYLCARLGREVGMSEAEGRLLLLASPMHDVGKIGIPDRILLKADRLDGEEWEIMKTHTLIGSEILAGSESDLLQMAELIALTHHEKWDGSGYPRGLKGEEIPLVGRIAAICDVFDALTSVRPYKLASSAQEAMAFISNQSGRHFDPHLVAVFQRILPDLLQIQEKYADR